LRNENEERKKKERDKTRSVEQAIQRESETKKRDLDKGNDEGEERKGGKRVKTRLLEY